MDDYANAKCGVLRVTWPLNFLRTGYYTRPYGYLDEPVTNGRWWSSVTGSSPRGHYLRTAPGIVYARDNDLRGTGIALRCVAR